MSSGAVIATQLTDHSSRYRTLTVGGVDVVLEPGTSGRLGTPIDTIRVTERGHEGVSSMAFTVEDFSGEFTVADGMEVAFQRVGAAQPTDNFTFRGWVDHWDQMPANPGRVFDISAIGPEALLDWSVLLADLVLPVGMTGLDAVQSAAANSYGAGPLRWNSRGAGFASNQLFPVAGDLAAFTLPAALTIAAGTSLRESIRQILVAVSATDDLGAGLYVATVDFFFGLRIFLVAGGLDAISCNVLDWNPVSFVLDTAASNSYGATQDLHYDREGATVRAVFVKGLNAAGTGLVTDGSGMVGATAYITDNTSDSAARLSLIGSSYLASYAIKLRASAKLGPVLPSMFDSVHPGEPIVIRDTSYANVNATAGGQITGEIAQIDKEFIGSLETWTFAFGGFPPSGTNLMRRFTGQPRG